MTTLISLPIEILLMVFEYVSMSDLSFVAQCSKEFYSIFKLLMGRRMISEDRSIEYHWIKPLLVDIIRRDEGRLVETITYWYGKKHGCQVVYDPMTQCPIRVAHYKNDLLDGEFVERTGIPYTKGIYALGMKTGKWIWYDGPDSIISYYREDQLDGLRVTICNNMILKLEHWIDGIQIYCWHSRNVPMCSPLCTPMPYLINVNEIDDHQRRYDFGDPPFD